MSAQDFGANDWLVDEMYEQYLANPTSVDPAWIEYFKTNKPGAPATSASTGSPSVAPSKGVPPVPKAQQKAAQPAPVVAPTPAPAVAAPVAPAPVVPAAQQPVLRETAAAQPTPADPIVKPVPVLITPAASSPNQSAEFQPA